MRIFIAVCATVAAACLVAFAGTPRTDLQIRQELQTNGACGEGTNRNAHVLFNLSTDTEWKVSVRQWGGDDSPKGMNREFDLPPGTNTGPIVCVVVATGQFGHVRVISATKVRTGEVYQHPLDQ
jgi:hypothetical protein